MDYVWSTVNMKARWSKLEGDVRHGNWTACGLTAHFGQHHSNDLEEALGILKISLVDCVQEEKYLKKTEDYCILNLGTIFVRLNSNNEALRNNRVNFGGGRVRGVGHV